LIKNINVDIEKYENESKTMLSRMEVTLKDLRQLNVESDPNKRFEVFLENIFNHLFDLLFLFFIQ